MYTMKKYVCLGTLSSNESQLSSIDDNALLSASLSLSILTNQQSRELKDSSDDENSQTILSSSPQSKIANQLIKNSHTDEPSRLPVDVSVDYWTIIDNQKEKKDGIRTIKSSLKSNIRVLTITRQLTMNSDGKISSSFTVTYVTLMKFGKKLKDIQNTKMIEPQTITGINRIVCTSKSHNVELKGMLICRILYEPKSHRTK
ncbi:unnamed protein product [Rotaria sordida]|uniref:Phosphofurin acidic cluster sorting protein 1/2 C-terminal domain-containing protein n=1 Tax=Rotaria sordida TaxID=392033 RepID=A0A815TPP5_9BILA|nr:unnamed protein product [Rotaria sordida]CAF1504968.1 unnamed protein product [Rotaria sordida]